jgi:hypothetical protein
MQIPKDSTDITTYFVLRDSATHAPKTDVTVTDIDLYYVSHKTAISSKADATALDAANSAHADNKAFNVGQGIYRIDWPDVWTGAVGTTVNLAVVCSGVDTEFLECEIVGVGQTGDAYPVVTNVTYGNSALSARIPAALTANGNIKASLVEILTTALTETAGYLAAAFKKLFNVATPVLTCESVNQTANNGDIKTVTDKLDDMITDIEGDYVFRDIALHNAYFYLDLNSSRLAMLANETNGLAAIKAAIPTADTIKTAIEADGSKLDHLWEATEDDGGVRRFTENALEQAPSSGSAPTAVQIRQEMDSNSTKLTAILEDTGTTIPAMIAADSGAGAISHAYTLTDSADGNPIDGAEVWVTTDAAGVNVIASGTTNSSGIVTFMLDAGTYYFWRKRSGYNFTNPDQETVA